MPACSCTCPLTSTRSAFTFCLHEPQTLPSYTLQHIPRSLSHQTDLDLARDLYTDPVLVFVLGLGSKPGPGPGPMHGPMTPHLGRLGLARHVRLVRGRGPASRGPVPPNARKRGTLCQYRDCKVRCVGTRANSTGQRVADTLRQYQPARRYSVGGYPASSSGCESRSEISLAC
eukprot:147600-Rhodomonas_salina.1